MIYDADIDFGDIENIPLIATEDSKNWNKELKLDPLSSLQKKQCINILNNYSNLWSGIPRIANVGDYVIRLKPDSLPNRKKKKLTESQKLWKMRKWYKHV